jgi:hypothetical protein
VTKFTRGGISVRNQPMGLDGGGGGGGGGAGDGGGSPGKRERPKWVDPTSSEVPSARGAGAVRREAGSVAGGGARALASGRTRVFKDPANIACVVVAAGAARGARCPARPSLTPFTPPPPRFLSHLQHGRVP